MRPPSASTRSLRPTSPVRGVDDRTAVGDPLKCVEDLAEQDVVVGQDDT
jgi:hypothetical protein